MATRSLGQLTIDLIAKTFGFEQGMDKAARKAKSGGKEIEGALTGAFKTIGAAVAGFVAGLATVDTALRGFQQSVDFADRMDELSARFKISTETLSEWAYAAKLTGSDIEGLAGIIPKFSKTVADAADAGSEAGKTFAALGISVKDQAGQLRSFQDLLPEIMDRFKGLNNETTETALAMQLFGRSGAEFLEFLNLGSDGLSKMGDRARELGIVIDTETAAKAAEFKDRVDDLRAATQGWFTQISSALLPTLTDLTNEMTDFVKEGGDAATIADSVASSIRDIAEAIRFLGQIGDVFDRIRGGLVGLEKQGNAAFKAISGQAFFAGDGLDSIKAQYEEGAAYIENGYKAMQRAQQEGVKKLQVQLIDPSEGFGDYKTQKALEERAKKIQEALDRLFAGGDQPSRKSGKSAAEQEAERLFQAYDSLAASLDQQIALFGQTSEAAKTRYEVEFGSLVNLEPKLKNYLIFKAEELDALKSLDEQQKAADAEVKRASQEYERERQRIDETVAELQAQAMWLAATTDERYKLEAAQLAGAHATEEDRAAMERWLRTVDDMHEADRNWAELNKNIADSLYDVVSGAESAGDAVKGFMDELNAQILRNITQDWADALTDMFKGFANGSGGGAGSWWGSLMGAFGFGGGMANGGTAQPWSIHEVNERGIEMATVRGRQYLLTGSAPVEVTPHRELVSAGGGGVTVNFNGYGRPDRRTAQQAAADVGVAAQRSLARNGRGGRS